MKTIEIGTQYEQRITVRSCDTAKVMGSGSLDVFATPAMVALMENTATKLVDEALEQGESTVGTEVCVSHLRASAVGAELRCVALLKATEGRKLQFDIEVFDSTEALVGKASHTRFLVDVERFMSKL